MSFFDQDPNKLPVWQMPWALAWPNDDWHKKMVEKGLVPALCGYDLQALNLKDCTLEEMARGKGMRLVLGLVRQRSDAPMVAEDDALEELLQSLRHNGGKQPAFNEETAEIYIPGTTEMRMYVGLHKNKFWPEPLEDPTIFLHQEDKNAVTSVVYYSDTEQKVHPCSEREEELDVYENSGFTAIFPKGLGYETDGAWSVLKAE